MKVVIQAVPWRQERKDNAEKLASETNGLIVWDENRSGYKTFLRVLEALGDDGGWVLEDDVRLTSNWAQKASTVVSEHPGLVIRAFSLWTTSGLLPGISYYALPCAYFPPGVPKSILEFSKTLTPAQIKTEALEQVHDHLVGLWLHSEGLSYWLETPSLVQHMEWRSLIDPRGRELSRLSPTFEE